MGLLTQLREQGVHITADGDKLVARAKRALTETVRTTIRANKGALVREIAGEAGARRMALIAARDAADLAGYRGALISGRVHLCANCSRFSFGTDPAGPGTCSRFGEGLV